MAEFASSPEPGQESRDVPLRAAFPPERWSWRANAESLVWGATAVIIALLVIVAFVVRHRAPTAGHEPGEGPGNRPIPNDSRPIDRGRP